MGHCWAPTRETCPETAALAALQKLEGVDGHTTWRGVMWEAWDLKKGGCLFWKVPDLLVDFKGKPKGKQPFVFKFMCCMIVLGGES